LKTVVLADIDNFHNYNIVYSYEKGNTVLNSIDSMINQLPFLQKNYNLRGDEFMFTFNGDFENVKALVFGLLQIVWDELEVTLSVAVTTIPNDYPMEVVYQILQRNLLKVKIHGKNKICYC
ncbi:hypothetical protein, partial [Flavobacterium sp.]|uniref:hypothetical protein n=1 Tax=Flavobacterium sp. TaxID=239 RepID=UPI002619F00F